MQRTSSSLLALACVLAVMGVAPAWAQQRALTLNDLTAWKAIAGTALARDGSWFAYRESATEADGSVTFRQTQGDRKYSFNAGEAPTGGGAAGGGRGGRGGGAAFSNLALAADAKYGAFLAYPTHAEQEQLRRQHKPVEEHASLVNLANGEKMDFPRVRRFAFSGDNPDWIAIQLLAPAPAAGAGAAAGGATAGGRGGRGGRGGNEPEEAPAVGTNLILRQLSTGQEITLGDVGDFGFDKHGQYLAWTVSAPDRTGNGIEVRDMATGAIRALDSGNEAFYTGLGWNDAGTALAALQGSDDAAHQEKHYAVLGFTDFSATGARETRFDPKDAANFPADFGISPNRNPEWSEDLGAVYFGIRKLTAAEPAAGRGGRGAAADDTANADDSVDLVLWNYQDPRLQAQQILQEPQDRNFSYLAEYRMGSHQFIRLADDTVRNVTPAPHDRFAVGRDPQPYELEGHLTGQTYTDIYVINLATGQRTLALPKARWPEEVAPDGTHFAFYRDGNYWVYDMTSGQSRNLTAGVPTSFVNTEDDHNLDKPPVAPVGWSRDSRDLLLSDNWDVWKVPVAGGAAVNLTGDGKRAGIRYRRPVNFDIESDPTALGFDLTRPLYLDAYGEWTKKDGMAVIQPGQAGAQRLMFDEASYMLLSKARNAGEYLYTRQTYVDPPDYYLAAAPGPGGTRLTDLAAQQAPFAWTSGTVLVDYTGPRGERLQGALHLPPDYVKGKQYPMILEFYEKMSQNAFQYQRPLLSGGGFNIADYLSNGYAIFDPDIDFKVDDPGISSSLCLVNAVKAAIATGIPDPAHIGIHGHSWGGYQTAFAITQTHLFAAAVAGAPLTDMISMYGLIYKNSGVTNGEIFEASQGRFTGPPWDLWQVYTRNSPVAGVKNVTTPLLMLSDYNDGAVDFTQGIEYYDALRREHKPVVLLDYPSQNHSLSKIADQKDYTIRMKQFFDHYLKGGPMPDWYAKGVPALEMNAYLKTFEKKYAAPAAAPRAAPPADEGGGGGR